MNTVPAHAAEKQHWSAAVFQKWTDGGLLEPNEERFNNPDEDITRGQFIALVNRVFHYTETKEQMFVDVPEDAWYKEEVAKAAAAGYIEGVENAQGELEARAEANISRQDAATILCRVFAIQESSGSINVPKSNFIDVSDISDYAKSYVQSLIAKGVITGYPDQTIKPKNNVTLAETLTMLDHLSGAVLNHEQAYNGSYDGNVIVNTGGVTLQNVTISGNLYLTEGIGQGNVTLDHVHVQGATFIKGGGEHTVTIKDSTFAGNVVVAKADGKIRISTDGQTAMRYVELRSGAILEQAEGSSGSWGNVNVTPSNADQPVILQGQFSNVRISSQASINVKQGMIASLEIANDAAPLKSKLQIEAGATINSLIANAAVEIVGDGDIQEATINYNDVSLAKWPDQVKVAAGITATIANSPVTANTQSPTTPVFGGGGGGGKRTTAADADAESVALAKQLLTLGDTSALIADKIDLPNLGANSTPITWQSDNENVLQIGSTVTGTVYGKIMRPDTGQPDAAVTLTATLRKGSTQDTKAFPVVIKARQDKSLNALTADGFKGEIHDNANEVTVYVPSSTDMDKVKLEVAFTGSGMKLGDSVITSGQAVHLEASQNLTVETDAYDSRTYRLNVHKVETGLATVVISTYNREPIQKEVKSKGTMQLIDGSVYSYGTGLYNGDIQIKGRGNSSWGMLKKSYAISMDKSTPLLDMPADDDFVLIANYADKSLMRNYTAYELARDLNMAYSPRMRYVELFLDGEYLGNYLLGEKIKIAPDRVPINKMSSKDKSGDAITGGYLIEKDGLDRLDPDDIYFNTDKIAGFDVFNIKDPKSSKLNQEQLKYITNYFQEAENALYSDHFTDPETGYSNYFDVDSIIDWYMVNELYKNVDAAFGTSVYLYKDKNGKISMGPVWDFDIGAGNIDYNGNDDPTGFYIKNAVWISRFFEDPAFVQKVKARWEQMKQKQIPDLFNRIDQTSNQLQASEQTNFSRWPILGTYVWPNASGWEERTTYDSEVQYLKDWLQKRYMWLDQAFSELP
ncbi:CotH kinase family protein [Paenibacillus doosanensis]|nr:CotH kinase family protein [Paenibacillus doosanensis]